MSDRREVKNLIQNVQQASHVYLGEPAAREIAKRRAKNKAARKARRANR